MNSRRSNSTAGACFSYRAANLQGASRRQAAPLSTAAKGRGPSKRHLLDQSHAPLGTGQQARQSSCGLVSGPRPPARRRLASTSWHQKARNARNSIRRGVRRIKFWARNAGNLFRGPIKFLAFRALNLSRRPAVASPKRSYSRRSGLLEGRRSSSGRRRDASAGSGWTCVACQRPDVQACCTLRCRRAQAAARLLEELKAEGRL